MEESLRIMQVSLRGVCMSVVRYHRNNVFIDTIVWFGNDATRLHSAFVQSLVSFGIPPLSLDRARIPRYMDKHVDGIRINPIGVGGQ